MSTHSAERDGGERGFTLVELLVAILAGTVVIGALFTLLDVTMHETTRTFSRIDATRRARTTLENIETELHSSCVAAHNAPIQTGSTGTQIAFVSQEGTAANLTPVEHQITFAGGKLTDTTYAATGGTAPNWTFASTGTTSTLISNVAQQVVGGNTTPVFQYFKYDVPRNAAGTAYADTSGNQYMILLDGHTSVPGTSPPVFPANAPAPLTSPLSSTDSAAAAEVVITLVVRPDVGANEVGSQENNTTMTDVNNTVTDSVVLTLTPVANTNANNATFAPCW